MSVLTVVNTDYGMVSHDQQPSGEEDTYEMVDQDHLSYSLSLRPAATTGDETAYEVIA